MSRWDRLALREGFLTAYPLGSGVPPHWAPADSPNARHAPDQVEFVSALVDEVGRRFEVDRGRVYASGMSNGGGLAALLALERPDLFAAVGSVAGLYPRWPGEPGPGRAVPLIAFHGGLDRIVPIDGGVRRLGAPVFAVDEWMAAYARACGCTGRTEERLGEVIRRVRYTGGRGGADVEWYRIADAGHTWPGGEPLPPVITGPTSPLLDATRLTWDFFAAHPLGAVRTGPSARRR
jgi:polyhydroxybutyrate depolymerase